MSDSDSDTNINNEQERIRKGKKNFYTQNWNLVEQSKDATCDDFPSDLKKYCMRYFGCRIRPLQKVVINSLLCNQQDVCAVLSPGYGSALCYQLPAVSNYLGLVIVVTPLTFAVREQIEFLKMCDVATGVLDFYDDYNANINNVLNDKYKIIYIAPQRVLGDHGRRLCNDLLNVKILMIAVLDAHCVSPYSHDYRLLYRELSILKETFPAVPVLALTTTPAPEVSTHITTYLGLRNPLILLSGFYRPNIYLQVITKIDENLINDILSVISQNKGSTLIYAFSMKDVLNIVQKLKDTEASSCKALYSGQPEDVANEVYKSFVANEFSILVTTSSYGLSIGKMDIRNVIHCHVPRDIETYYQEIGVAGMDGSQSQCTLFYSQQDMDAQEFLRYTSLPKSDKELRTRKDMLADILTEYVVTSQCRWSFILNHFENVVTLKRPATSSCCDNCKNSDAASPRTYICRDGKFDLTEDFIVFLEAVKVINDQKIPCNFETCITTIMDSPDLNKYNKSIQWWYKIAHMVKKRDLIRNENINSDENEKNCNYIVLQQGMRLIKHKLKGTKGKCLFYLDKDMKNEIMKIRLLHLIHNPARVLKKTLNPPPRSRNGQLLLQLKAKRSELSSRLGCPPYLIAPDNALWMMALKKPRMMKDLLLYKCEGFSWKMIYRFSHEFIAVIKRYCEQKLEAKNRSAKNKLIEREKRKVIIGRQIT